MDKFMFFYTRKVVTKDSEGKETILDVKDCFNVHCVVRATWASPLILVVMLNDGHEESKDAGTKGMEKIRQRDWYVSQIELFGEDIERFIKLTNTDFEPEMISCR